MAIGPIDPAASLMAPDGLPIVLSIEEGEQQHQPLPGDNQDEVVGGPVETHPPPSGSSTR